MGRNLSKLVIVVLILIAGARAWADFDPLKPATGLFIGGLSALLVGIILFYTFMEIKHRKKMTDNS